MAGVDPVGASAALFQALKAEAAVLKRKQQRKGIEYRVKEGSSACLPGRDSRLGSTVRQSAHQRRALQAAASSPTHATPPPRACAVRPNITRGTASASGDGSMLLASPKAARPITAPSVRGAPAESCCPISPLSHSGPARVATTLFHPQLLLALHHCHVLPLLLVQTALGKTGGSTDSGGGGGGAASGDVLDDYDPIAAQEKEHHDMMADLGKCREEASNLHHRVMTLLARREDLEHEGEKLAYMDGIEAERDEGMRAIETVRGGRGGEGRRRWHARSLSRGSWSNTPPPRSPLPARCVHACRRS